MSSLDASWPRPGTAEIVGLWLLAWAGLQADPRAITSADWTIRLLGVRAWLPVCAGAWAAVALTRRGGMEFGPVRWMFLYGAAGLCASLLVSVRPAEALYWGASFMAVALISAYSLCAASGARWLWATTCLVVAGVGLGAWFLAMARAPATTLHGITNHLPAVWGQPMIRETGIGRYLAVLSILCLCRAVILTAGPRRSLWLASAATLLVAVVVSASRSAMLGCAAGWGWVAMPWLLRRPIRLLLLAAVAALAAMAMFVSGRLPTDALTLFSGRTWIWAAAMELIQDSVWIGHGFHADRFWLAWPYRNHVSNALLHAAVQAGVLGATAFLAAWVLAWRYAVRALRLSLSRTQLEAGAVLAFLTVRGLFESTGAFYGVDWFLLASAFAILSCA